MVSWNILIATLQYLETKTNIKYKLIFISVEDDNNWHPSSCQSCKISHHRPSTKES